MGGRFLEDFKAIHARFGLRDLVSIEQDSVVRNRQLYNRPFGFIQCEHKSSSELIDNFSVYEDRFRDRRFIVWLDYANANERGRQLQEFSQLVGRLGALDVIKITLNASPQSLGDSGGISAEELQKRRFDKLNAQMADFIVEEFQRPESITSTNLPRLLAEAVRKAANIGIRSKPRLQVEPLSIFSYQDGNHRMMTATCILVDSADVIKFRSEWSNRGWQFSCRDWKDIHLIAVPDLSLKERFRIHEQLFANSVDYIHSELPFQFDPDVASSIEQLRQYASHYSRYPSFVRLSD